jgi:hypothetical protein
VSTTPLAASTFAVALTRYWFDPTENEMVSPSVAPDA